MQAFLPSSSRVSALFMLRCKIFIIGILQSSAAIPRRFPSIHPRPASSSLRQRCSPRIHCFSSTFGSCFDYVFGRLLIHWRRRHQSFCLLFYPVPQFRLHLSNFTASSVSTPVLRFHPFHLPAMQYRMHLSSLTASSVLNLNLNLTPTPARCGL